MAKDWKGGSASTFKTIGASNHTDHERGDADYYATEPAATDWLCKIEQFKSPILEPSCGEGHISRQLIANGYEVVSRDLVDRGYGEVADFLFFNNEQWEGDIIKSTDYPFMDEDKVNYLGIASCDTHDAIGEFYMNLYVTKESKKRGISNGINLSFYELNMENVEVVGNIFDNKGMFRDSDEKIMQWYLED